MPAQISGMMYERLKRDGAAAMAAKLDIPVMLMHMRGEPTTMNNLASMMM